MRDLTIDDVNLIVRKYLDVYEVRVAPDHLEFYFTFSNENIFEKNFESLRLELKKWNVVPMVRRKGAEYVLYVIKMPRRRYWSVWINVVFLILTIISTIWVGMGYYESYYGSTDLMHGLWGGFIYFSLPLLTILGSHEMGHYFAAKKHHIAASLPFFIPAPTMLGTLGAFISIREPMPDKKSLVDVGLAGPIVGFIVAIPVTIIGLFLGAQTPAHINLESTNTYLLFHVPLIYQFLEFLTPSSAFVHPVAMAGWVGFVVTAINLFPVGQLDGGHAARAVLGDKAKYVSYGFAALLIALGMFYLGWLIFGLFVIILGLRHPPPLNDIVKLDKKRLAIALTGVLIFAVTFVPVPVEYKVLQEKVNVIPHVDSKIFILNTEYAQKNLTLNISNSGEMRENITVRLITNGNFNVSCEKFAFSLDSNSYRILNVSVKALKSGNHNLGIQLKTLTGYEIRRNLTFNVFNVSSSLYFSPKHVNQSEFNVQLINEDGNRTVKFISLNGIAFNITNVQNDTLRIEHGITNLHIRVLGSTVIGAADYQNYEIALLRVAI